MDFNMNTMLSCYAFKRELYFQYGSLYERAKNAFSCYAYRVQTVLVVVYYYSEQEQL